MSDDKSVDILAGEGEFKLLKIQGKEFRIGRIKPIYYLKLLKVVGGVFRRCIKEIQALGTEWDKMSEVEAIITFLSMLEEDEYGRFLATFLETDDIALCKNIDQYELLELLETILKYNNIGLFVKKVQGVIKEIQNQLSNANTAS